MTCAFRDLCPPLVSTVFTRTQLLNVHSTQSHVIAMYMTHDTLESSRDHLTSSGQEITFGFLSRMSHLMLHHSGYRSVTHAPQRPKSVFQQVILSKDLRGRRGAGKNRWRNRPRAMIKCTEFPQRVRGRQLLKPRSSSLSLNIDDLVHEQKVTESVYLYLAPILVSFVKMYLLSTSVSLSSPGSWSKANQFVSDIL